MRDDPVERTPGDELSDAETRAHAHGPRADPPNLGVPITPLPGLSVLAELATRGSVPDIQLRDEPSLGPQPLLKPVKPDEHGIGEKTGKYRIRGEIARGGVGVVFKGHDADLGRDVALKFLHSTYEKNPAFVERFIEEAQIGAQLQHPGIVPVYDLSITEGRPFFTMKLIKGRTLSAELLDRPAISKDRRKYIALFEQICQTMAYAHARGVVHRDLKPANVMLGSFGEVKIVDWGMGKVLGHGGVEDEKRLFESSQLSIVATVRGKHGSQSIAGSIMGTPAYMPPEQAAGEIEILNERSDVFSLGAILCEILTGQPPYTGSGTQVIEKALRCRLEDARARLAACGADPEIVQLANDCLMPAPGARPAHAGEVAERVGAYLADAEQRVRDAQIKARAAKRTQKLTVAAGVVIALALVVSVLFWREAGIERDNSMFAEGAARRAEKEARDAEHLEKQARELADLRLGQTQAAAKQERLARLEADEALRRYDLLANVVNLRDAKATEASLYPPWPEKSAAMRTWLAKARPLAAALPDLEKTLADVRQKAVAADGKYEFEDKSQQYLHDQLAALIDNVAPFAAAEVPAVEERLAWAESVESESLTRFDREWQRTIAAIAASDRYGGLEVGRQIGLVPLGEDPQSGLFEFVHLYSGTRGKAMPVRSAVTEDTGIVFVLVPGGTFTMGAQKTDESGPNFDPNASRDEGPPHQVDLAAFFLSKYEMTQAQWQRLTRGEEPSHAFDTAATPIDLAVKPVQQVSWTQCDELLRRHGLVLPTEAQWEYACRAGSTTPWSFGADPAELGRYGNTYDLSAKQKGFNPGTGQPSPTEDGWLWPSPVGVFAPNAFGLHDMHGNVWEWCRDAKGAYGEVQGRPGDGLRVVVGGSRVDRGGSFAFPADRARSSYRYQDAAETRDYNLGVRPARAILPGR